MFYSLLEYDELDRERIKKTNYNKSNGSFEESTEYIYDAYVNFPIPVGSPPIGNLTEIIKNRGLPQEQAQLLTYNPSGEVIEITYDFFGLEQNYSESFTTNEFEKPLTHTLPSGKGTQRFVYTEAGNLQDVFVKELGGTEELYVNYSDYNARNQHQKKILKNGILTSYGYDIIGKLQSLKTTRGLLEYQNLGYQFNQVGFASDIMDYRVNTQDLSGKNTDATQHFQYDSVGRLDKAQWGNEGETPSPEIFDYSYDSLGNMTQKEIKLWNGGSSFTRLSYKGMKYDRQQVKKAYNSEIEDSNSEALDVIYDLLGNMVQKRVRNDQGIQAEWNYSYNAANRLIQVQKGGRTLLQFAYDHSGKRIQKLYLRENASTVTTWYLGSSF